MCAGNSSGCGRRGTEIRPFIRTDTTFGDYGNVPTMLPTTGGWIRRPRLHVYHIEANPQATHRFHGFSILVGGIIDHLEPKVDRFYPGFPLENCKFPTSSEWGLLSLGTVGGTSTLQQKINYVTVGKEAHQMQVLFRNIGTCGWMTTS